MIRCLALILAQFLVLWPGLAAAQDLPALFGVQGVAPDDVLNIRDQPSAAGAILGALPPDTAGLEVLALSEDGAWGRVSAGETMGWVAMRYLRAMPPADPARVPRPLRCLGTEPFWALSRDPVGGGSWTLPEDERRLAFPVDHVAPGGYYLYAEDMTARYYHLTITREACSDGMSDREYGLSARLFVQFREGNQLYTGCCTLDAR